MRADGFKDFGRFHITFLNTSKFSVLDSGVYTANTT
jgi:hypothetical protein